MKFIFVGASGFVGTYALQLARKMGYQAIGTQSADRHPGLVTFDLLTDRIAGCLPVDYVQSRDRVYGVVCASVRQIDQCLRERATTYPINVTQTIQLIHDFIELGIRPVFLSTSYVFDGALGYYPEQHPHSPVCEYGRQKATVEHYLAESLPDVLVLRLDKIVGDSPQDDHLFTEWLGWIQQSKPVTCIAGQVLAPTFVTDIGRALLIACERELKGLYNTANTEFFSREELAVQFLAAMGAKAQIVSKPQDQFRFLDPRPAKTYLDSTKFIKATGLRFTSMREVMESFARNAGFRR